MTSLGAGNGCPGEKGLWADKRCLGLERQGPPIPLWEATLSPVPPSSPRSPHPPGPTGTCAWGWRTEGPGKAAAPAQPSRQRGWGQGQPVGRRGTRGGAGASGQLTQPLPRQAVPRPNTRGLSALADPEAPSLPPPCPLRGTFSPGRPESQGTRDCVPEGRAAAQSYGAGRVLQGDWWGRGSRVKTGGGGGG